MQTLLIGCDNFIQRPQKEIRLWSLIRKRVMQGRLSDHLDCCRWLFSECGARITPFPNRKDLLSAGKALGLSQL